ncbi:MFS transporter [Streptomyces sp. 900116325]
MFTTGFRRTDAQAVAARYGLPSPTTAEAPEAGVRGRFAAVASLSAPGSRIATPLLWVASFAGLLLVYGVSTWLPQLMRASGDSLSSSVTFLMIINAGGIVGMLVAGRAADRFGAVRISAIWFVLTACGTFLLRAHLPLGVAYTVAFITGIWLFSAQTMVYAATSTVYAPAQRATGLGWAGSPASAEPARSSAPGSAAPSSRAATPASDSPPSPPPYWARPRSAWCHWLVAPGAGRPHNRPRRWPVRPTDSLPRRTSRVTPSDAPAEPRPTPGVPRARPLRATGAPRNPAAEPLTNRVPGDQNQGAMNLSSSDEHDRLAVAWTRWSPRPHRPWQTSTTVRRSRSVASASAVYRTR